ncbi:MAG: hypothetical protein ACRC2V_15615 [Xenococcaceae cyanobacterium]
MLNQSLFMDAMEDFMAYYGKSLVENKLAYQAWYKYLSKHLTDDNLVSALEVAIEKFEFMPSPQKLIEAIKGSQETLAYEEWSKCVHAATRNDAENLVLSSHAEKALSSMGGIKRLKEVEVEKLHGILAKDFVNRWLQYKSAIASGLVDAPAPQLKAVPDLPKPRPLPSVADGRVSASPEDPLATAEQWEEFKARMSSLWKKGEGA